MAGDFADNPMRDHAIPLAGYMTVRRWIESGHFATSTQAFCWRRGRAIWAHRARPMLPGSRWLILASAASE